VFQNTQDSFLECINIFHTVCIQVNSINSSTESCRLEFGWTPKKVNCVRFRALLVLNIYFCLPGYGITYSLGGNQSFEIICCLHLQVGNQLYYEDGNNSSCETLIIIYQTIRFHNPEDHNLDCHGIILELSCINPGIRCAEQHPSAKLNAVS
jgi:hypothetical protein